MMSARVQLRYNFRFKPWCRQFSMRWILVQQIAQYGLDAGWAAEALRGLRPENQIFHDGFGAHDAACSDGVEHARRCASGP